MKKSKINSNLFAMVSLFSVGTYYASSSMFPEDNINSQKGTLSEQKSLLEKKKSLVDSLSSSFIKNNKDATFSQWLNTPEAIENYEKWRKSPTGVSSLEGDFEKTDTFKKDLNIWAGNTKRSIQEFKKIALKKQAYEQAFNSWKNTSEGFNALKSNYIASNKYNTNISNWRNGSNRSEDIKDYLKTPAAKSDYTKWIKQPSNKEKLLNLWKTKDDYKLKSALWLRSQNNKLDKQSWINSPSGKSFFANWKNSDTYQESIINNWKTTQDYNQKANAWINIYGSKKPLVSYKNQESDWANKYLEYKNSRAGNQEIENKLKKRQEYIDAKNTWSTRAKVAWLNSDESNSKYHAWRKTSQGRETLKATFTRQSHYQGLKNSWIDNNYQGKSKDRWINEEDVTRQYNNWKVTPSAKSALQATWKKDAHYLNSLQKWIGEQTSSIQKNAWAQSSEAINKYLDWKKSDAIQKELLSHWKATTSYTTFLNTWTRANYNVINKQNWLNQDQSKSYYQKWIKTPVAKNLVKGIWEKTTNYQETLNSWAKANFNYSNHSKSIWSKTQDSLNDYNNWKSQSSNLELLKTHWKNQSNYSNQFKQWIQRQNFSKNLWKSTSDSLNKYNTWKALDAKQTLLENHWKTTSYYQDKKTSWANTYGLNLWKSTGTASSNYQSIKNTNQFKNQFINHWKTTSNYQTSLKKWTNNYHFSLWHNSRNAFTKYKEYVQTQAGNSELKNHWKTTSDYLAKRKAFIQSQKDSSDKSTWLSSGESAFYANHWKDSLRGQAKLLEEWKKTDDFTNKKNTWWNTYTPSHSKSQWVNDMQKSKFNNYEQFASNSKWSKKYNRYIRSYPSSLKTYYQTLPIYQQKKDHWIANNYQKTLQTKWNNLQASSDSYDVWKESEEGKRVLEAAFLKSDSYSQNLKTYANNNLRSKTDKLTWLRNHGNKDYEEWKNSAQGKQYLANKWEKTNDYNVKKQDWIDQGSVKRSFETWLKQEDATLAYNDWKQDPDSLNALKEKWEETTKGANAFLIEVNKWFNQNNPSLDTKEKWLNDKSSLDDKFEQWFSSQNLKNLKEKWIYSDDFKSKAETSDLKNTFLNNPTQLKNMMSDWFKNWASSSSEKKFKVLQNKNRMQTPQYFINKEGKKFFTFNIAPALFGFFAGGNNNEEGTSTVAEWFLTKYTQDIYEHKRKADGSISADFVNDKKEYLEALSQFFVEQEFNFRKDYKPWWVDLHQKYLEDEATFALKNPQYKATHYERYLNYLHHNYSKSTNQEQYLTNLKVWAKSYWLNNLDESYLDYKKEEFKKDLTSYNNALKLWATHKQNGIDVFKKSDEAKNAYNSWVDPNPIATTAANYKSNYQYLNDLKSYYNAPVSKHLINRGQFEYYYNSNGVSSRKYQAWIDPKIETNYKNSQNYINDLKQYTNNEKGKNVYLKSDQAKKDYRNWNENSETAYQNSFQHRIDMSKYFQFNDQGISQGKNHYLNSEVATSDYDEWLKHHKESKYQKGNNDFDANFNSWTGNRDNWINFYDNDFKSNEDYSNHIYQNNDQYEIDFIKWRDNKLGNNRELASFNYYLTTNKAKSDLASYLRANPWAKESLEYKYQYTSGKTTFSSDYATYRDQIKQGQSKSNGYLAYLTFDLASRDYNNWIQSRGNHYYLQSDQYQNDFNEYLTAPTSSGDVSRGHKFYLSHQDSNVEFNSWLEKTKENDYLNSQTFNNDFTRFINQIKSGQSLANGHLFYLTKQSANNDYENWKNQKIEAAFKNQESYYNNKLQTWMEQWIKTRANGINLYANHEQSNSDYNTWLKLDKNNQYSKASTYLNDFNSYLNARKSGETFNNGYSFYLNHIQSNKDYLAWLNKNYEDAYKRSEQFNEDFNDWETISKGLNDYKASTQSNLDYQQWIYQQGEAPYQASEKFKNDIDTWSRTKSNGLSYYQNSDQFNKDWNDIVDAKFALSSRHQEVIARLKPIHSKDIYKNSRQFVNDYNSWDDPNQRTKAKYDSSPDSTFANDLNDYYKNDDHQLGVYKNSLQSQKDYTLYKNDIKKESDYLSNNQASLDLKNYFNNFDNGKALFKDSPFVLAKLTRTEDNYQKSSQFTQDTKQFIENSGYSYLDNYLSGRRLKNFYDSWKDPVGVEPDPKVFKTTPKFIESINNWSANIVNGRRAFEASTLAQTLYTRYKNR